MDSAYVVVESVFLFRHFYNELTGLSRAFGRFFNKRPLSFCEDAHVHFSLLSERG